MEEFRRGELAARSGCNPETIRFWETKGIIPEPIRSIAGHRLYGAEDVARLKLIRKLRTLGLSLTEIADLISLGKKGGTCESVRSLLLRHLGIVERQMQALLDVKQTLEEAVEACQQNGNSRCEFIALPSL